MISIDTNVLLRYLLQDDKTQSPKANKLFVSKDKILLTDVTLIETIWTLKGNRYKLKKDELIQVINELFKEPNLEFEDGQCVWRALNVFRTSEAIKVGSKKKDLDFSDALILEKSKTIITSKDESFKGLYSFDKAAQQVEEIISP